MYYAPHTLEIKKTSEERDRYNRTAGTFDWWESVGPCRCDDSTTQEIRDANGKAFIPKYHIVSSRNDIQAGDYVRAMDGENVRGEGEVKRVIRTNYLDYESIYI